MVYAYGLEYYFHAKVLSVKGTLALDFFLYFFFQGSILYGAQISKLKRFRLLFRIREVIKIC